VSFMEKSKPTKSMEIHENQEIAFLFILSLILRMPRPQVSPNFYIVKGGPTNPGSEFIKKVEPSKVLPNALEWNPVHS
jgi:hypothetical protein